MKKLFLTIALSFFLTASAWAISGPFMQSIVGSGGNVCSGTYGTSSGADNSAASAYIIRLRPITIDCNSPATYSIKAVLQDVDVDTREIKFLIYDDDGDSGDAGTRLYESSAMYDASTASSYEIVEDSGVTTSLSPGKYWVGPLYESTGNASEFQYDGTTGSLTLKHIQGDFTSPATWDTDNDSTSTAQDCYWLDF